MLAFYSVSHLPRPELPLAFAEFRRILAPGGTRRYVVARR